MGREFELKYRATRSQQDAIRAEFGNFATTDMETTYYATPEGAMAAKKITLRRRLENGKSICTVKTPAHSGGRGEWETECGDIQAAIPVLCKLGCPEDLVTLAESGLIAVCGARFTRLHTEITLGTDTVELALDAGALLGGGKEVPHRGCAAAAEAGQRRSSSRVCAEARNKIRSDPGGEKQIPPGS